MSTSKRVVAEKLPAKKEEEVSLPAKQDVKALAIYPTKADVDKALEKSEKLVEIKKKINSYITAIKEAKIINVTTAKAVDSQVAEAKRYSKALAEEGELKRQPYTHTAKSLKAFYDSLTEELDQVVVAGQKAVIAFNAAEQKKEDEKQRKIQAQTNKLGEWIRNGVELINNAWTLEEVEEAGEKVLPAFKKEDYHLLAPDAVDKAFSSMKELGKSRYIGIGDGSIVKAENNDPDGDPDEALSTEEAIDAAQEILDAVKETSDQTISVSKPVTKFNTTVTKTIAFKPFKKEMDVDKKFMSIDPVKVKAYLAEHKEEIKKSLDSGQGILHVVGGLEFYYEEGTRTR